MKRKEESAKFFFRLAEIGFTVLMAAPTAAYMLGREIPFPWYVATVVVGAGAVATFAWVGQRLLKGVA